MHKFFYSLFLILAIGVFLILSWKNPYGTSSLIGNFDPFPDSLHYVVPARNFVNGDGFVFAREGGKTVIAVPPLYSLTLIPIYFLNNDARSYYFANLILGVISIILLFKISRKLTKSAWMTGLLLFTYVTSFVIYWQTSLAMAENVLLPICFGGLYLALQPLNNKTLILATLLSVACYGSKYVSLPITGIFLLFWMWRIWTEQKKPAMIKNIVLVVLLALLTFLLFNGQEFFSYLIKLWQGNLRHDLQAQEQTAWLSLEYFSESFPKYFSALMGVPIYNLWYTKAILPVGLAAIALSWCLYAIFKLPKQRKLATLLLTLTFAQLAFLSIILMIEGRYAFVFIPIIFTGTAAMLGWLVEKGKKKFSQRTNNFMQMGFAGFLAGLLLLSNFKDLKTQLLLNFKGGEMPWWQVGVQAADQFMQMKTENIAEKPIIISSLSPFVWDFYKQSAYAVLPLSANQSMAKEKIWGEDFEANHLLDYYQEQSQTGRLIYLATVGFGRNDWPILEEYKANGFQLELLKEDCVGACKIYRVNFINVIQ